MRPYTLIARATVLAASSVLLGCGGSDPTTPPEIREPALFQGKVAAAPTGRADAPAVVIASDRSRLVVRADPSTGVITGAVGTLADGQSMSVSLDPAGRPSRAVIAGDVYLFAGYAGGKVDIIVLSADGKRFTASGVTVPARLWAEYEGVRSSTGRRAGSTPGPSRSYSVTQIGLVDWVKIGGLALSTVACVTQVAAVGATLPASLASVPLVTAFCTATALSVAAFVTHTDATPLARSAELVSAVGDFLGCFKNADCLQLIYTTFSEIVSTTDAVLSRKQDHADWVLERHACPSAPPANDPFCFNGVYTLISVDGHSLPYRNLSSRRETYSHAGGTRYLVTWDIRYVVGHPSAGSETIDLATYFTGPPPQRFGIDSIAFGQPGSDAGYFVYRVDP